MLLPHFFSITDITTTDTVVNAQLQINELHAIFQGHFPGQPVVPGVCMLQMVKEIIEQVVQKKLTLIKSPDIKFLAVIDPSKNNSISATLQYSINDNSNLVVTAILFKNELIYFKSKNVYALLEEFA
jgi:3-hydroxyacyl-[acyl-carrier-protein] dehydratase